MQQRISMTSDRLIVAVDSGLALKPKTRAEVWRHTNDLVERLAPLGVTFMLGPSLYACGSDLIAEIHNERHKPRPKVFANLNLEGSPRDLGLASQLLRETEPEFLTVMCSAGVTAIRTLRAALPKTEILGVTLFPGQAWDHAEHLYGKNFKQAAIDLARVGLEAGVDGFVCLGPEIDFILEEAAQEVSICIVDDAAPVGALISHRANRVIVGQPITEALDPYTATTEILENLSKKAPAP